VFLDLSRTGKYVLRTDRNSANNKDERKCFKERAVAMESDSMATHPHALKHFLFHPFVIGRISIRSEHILTRSGKDLEH